MTTAQERAHLAELAEDERKRKPVRTAVQAGAGVAAFTVLEFVLAYFHADLDPREPGVQDSFPTLFTGAVMVLGAYLAAKWMNRRSSHTD